MDLKRQMEQDSYNPKPPKQKGNGTQLAPYEKSEMLHCINTNKRNMKIKVKLMKKRLR